MSAWQEFYLFFATIQVLDSDIKITDKFHFCRRKKYVIILSLCTQRCYGRHTCNVSRKSVNH